MILPFNDHKLKIKSLSDLIPDIRNTGDNRQLN